MSPTDTNALQRLNEGYVRSVQNSDAAWFEAHLAPNFVNRNSDCVVEDRATFIARIARPHSLSGLQAQDVCIHMHGDLAIISAQTAYLKPDGSPGTGRYTDVWSRQDGHWSCVYADVTRS